MIDQKNDELSLFGGGGGGGGAAKGPFARAGVKLTRAAGRKAIAAGAKRKMGLPKGGLKRPPMPKALKAKLRSIKRKGG